MGMVSIQLVDVVYQLHAHATQAAIGFHNQWKTNRAYLIHWNKGISFAVYENGTWIDRARQSSMDLHFAYVAEASILDSRIYFQDEGGAPPPNNPIHP